MSNDFIIFSAASAVVVILLVSIIAIVDEKTIATNCVINISKQNLTFDEISKLCGVGK
jgi:hypothetical protein